jgi:PPM family protein phosphatase
VITRALGMAEQTEVDVNTWDLEPGDVCLVCCDGLTGMVPDRRIAEILGREPDLETACKRLVEEANEAGGVDNITVALVRYDPIRQ